MLLKLDKDAVKKQKFWILLGVFLLIWVIGLVTLKVSGSAPIEDAKKEFEKAKTAIKPHTAAPKNVDTFLPPWEKYGKQFREHKDKVWEDAWKGQKDLITWPNSPRAPMQDWWNNATSFQDWK